MNLRSTPNPTNPADASSSAAQPPSVTHPVDKTDAGNASADNGAASKSNGSSTANGVDRMSSHTASGGAVSTDSMVQEFLAEQGAGQTTLVPPREPLGKHIATLIGQRHGLLLVLTTLLLWAAMTLRPPGEGMA